MVSDLFPFCILVILQTSLFKCVNDFLNFGFGSQLTGRWPQAAQRYLLKAFTPHGEERHFHPSH